MIDQYFKQRTGTSVNISIKPHFGALLRLYRRLFCAHEAHFWCSFKLLTPINRLYYFKIYIKQNVGNFDVFICQKVADWRAYHSVYVH